MLDVNKNAHLYGNHAHKQDTANQNSHLAIGRISLDAHGIDIRCLQD